MMIRLALSHLASAQARQVAARGLVVACALGYLITLAVSFARGGDLRGWLFSLLIWTLFVYVPLRIILEALQSIAPAMRRGLAAATVGRTDRYATRASISLVVEALLERDVVMPRIATPLQRLKAHDGAVAILSHLGQKGFGELHEAITRCLGLVDRWMSELATAAYSPTPPPIQARWTDLRALIALTAAAKALLAAYADQAGTPLTLPASPDRHLGEYLDTCLDFSDELALEVDPLPWTEPPLAVPVDPVTVDSLRDAWRAFASAEPPALTTRTAFVNTLFPQPVGGRSSTSQR